MDKTVPTCYTITILRETQGKKRSQKLKGAYIMLEKMLKVFYEFQVLYIH